MNKTRTCFATLAVAALISTSAVMAGEFELRFEDERVVHEIMSHVEQDDFRAKTLIHQIVLSEPFRFRRLPTDESKDAK